MGYLFVLSLGCGEEGHRGLRVYEVFFFLTAVLIERRLPRVQSSSGSTSSGLDVDYCCVSRRCGDPGTLLRVWLSGPLAFLSVGRSIEDRCFSCTCCSHVTGHKRRAAVTLPHVDGAEHDPTFKGKRAIFRLDLHSFIGN